MHCRAETADLQSPGGSGLQAPCWEGSHIFRREASLGLKTESCFLGESKISNHLGFIYHPGASAGEE